MEYVDHMDDKYLGRMVATPNTIRAIRSLRRELDPHNVFWLGHHDH